MKLKIITGLAVLSFSCNLLAEIEISFSEQEQEQSYIQDEAPHEHVLSADEAAKFYEQIDLKSNLEIFKFKFAQEYWYECTDVITGNYSSYNCASKRGISQILNKFINSYLSSCVQEAMDMNDRGVIDKLHIIHNGILGDRNHSPKSMHAENRAIDIKTFKITTTDRRELNIVYAEKKNREFFTKFRSCWGKAVAENNGCPAYQGSYLRTGSIGWEDRNHQYHLHTSVPYCVNGKYGSYYYNR